MCFLSILHAAMEGCGWFTVLVEDMRNEIARQLDPVSATMLGWTCRIEHARHVSQKDPWSYKSINIMSIAARLGFKDVFEYLIDYYKKEEKYQWPMFMAALGSEQEDLFDWIKIRFRLFFDSTIADDPDHWFLNSLHAMSWPMYVRASKAVLVVDSQILDFMNGKEPAFYDSRVLHDVLKRCLYAGGTCSSYNLFRLVYTDGTAALCEDAYTQHKPKVFEYVENCYYGLITSIMRAGNVDTLDHLQRTYPPTIHSLFVSEQFPLCAKNAINECLRHYRQYPTWPRDIVPMVKRLLSLGCPWSKHSLDHLVSAMRARYTWDKQQLIQLRDLGMPMILQEAYLKEEESSSYMKWIRNCLMKGLSYSSSLLQTLSQQPLFHVIQRPAFFHVKHTEAADQ